MNLITARIVFAEEFHTHISIRSRRQRRDASRRDNAIGESQVLILRAGNIIEPLRACFARHSKRMP